MRSGTRTVTPVTHLSRAAGLCLSPGCHPASALRRGEAAAPWRLDAEVIAVLALAVVA